MILIKWFYIFSIDTKKANARGPNEQWSGDASRTSGFAVEDTRVDVLIGDEIQDESANNQKRDRPIWLVESTVISTDPSQVKFIQFFWNLNHKMKNIVIKS